MERLLYPNSQVHSVHISRFLSVISAFPADGEVTKARAEAKKGDRVAGRHLGHHTLT